MRWTDIGVIYTISGKVVGGGGVDSRGEKWEELLQITAPRNQEEEKIQKSSGAERTTTQQETGTQQLTSYYRVFVHCLKIYWCGWYNKKLNGH